jgi:mRNA interferase RelE/StbE
MLTPEIYSVSLRPRAKKEIRNLDRQILTRISKAIDSLTENPRPPGCLKVKTTEGLWRIRVGDWRIGYEIDDAAQTVIIITIGHRSEFYD